jgi:hypothetical protein
MIPASLMDCGLIALGEKNRPRYEQQLKNRRVDVPTRSRDELLAQHRVLVVSFFTPDYKDASERLARTLDGFEIPHDIVEVPKPPGDWKESWYSSETDKAEFLLKMLDKHEDYETLVWLDADGEMIRFPRLLWNIPTDLGLHYRAFKEPISSTVAVKRGARDLLEKWAIESKIACKAGLKCPSQKALKAVLHKNKVTWTQLPMAYALLWRWNSRDRAEKNGVFIHERWNRNAKIPTKDKHGRKIPKSKRKEKMS